MTLLFLDICFQSLFVFESDNLNLVHDLVELKHSPRSFNQGEVDLQGDQKQLVQPASIQFDIYKIDPSAIHAEI